MGATPAERASDAAAKLRPITDGVVTIRRPAPGDAELLVAGRDAVSERFLGPGADEPSPVACVVVGGSVVGWVDYDADDRPWLADGELNLGYSLFAAHRGRGHATRALRLLVHHLALVAGTTGHDTATLLIDPDNEASLRLARRAGFDEVGQVDGQRFFKRALPPVVCTDGVVTIRPQRADDIEADLAAKDDAQIDWMWLPGQRESWEAMTAQEQRRHALRHLEASADAFGTGPKWTFAVDAAEAFYVAYADADLANPDVPAGEANISYSAHPAHRGKGYVARAVRLVAAFLADHTGARFAHVIVDADNAPSLRVAAAVGAQEAERWVDDHGRTMVRHVLDLRPAWTRDSPMRTTDEREG